ncbi:unannotated protein [freshwater metagenome]|uniref:Unannotated protein n=1 Tax=freshwater metagenome TaxID=449393 RepID=A0A6J6IM32_9ZZZZ|nr:DUF87 domain-containing protein [Actinomycetota bacterium]
MQFIWYLPSLFIGLAVGFSSGYWQVGLVSLITVSALVSVQIYKNRYPAFEKGATVHISPGQVAIANRVLPRFEWLWKKQWHEIIEEHFRTKAAPGFLDQLLVTKSEQGFFQDSGTALQLWLGATSSKEVVIDLAKDGPHLIIVGPTGSGKSELLKLMLSSMIEQKRCELVLFDFKGGATLERFAAESIGLATDLNLPMQQKLWDLVSAELARREALFAQKGVQDIQQFNSGGEQLKQLVVVIDEFAAALATGTKATSCIEDVCARGRSLGVHLIAATQSLTGIPRSMLTNMRAKVAMNSSDPIDLVQLGISSQKAGSPQLEGWAAAILVTANKSAECFYFPLGFTPRPKPVASIPSGEQMRPARSQLLRQMYSSPEPELGLPAEPVSNPDSQLLSRMEGLRWSVRR